MPFIRLVHSCVPRSTSTPSPTRSLWSVNVGVTTDVIGLTETWHEDADDVALRRLRSTSLQMLERARPVRPGAKTDDIFYQNYGGLAVVASSAVRLSKISAPFEPISRRSLLSISSPG